MNVSRILSPSRMPARDADGWVYHPDLDNLLVDGDADDERPLDLAKVSAAGYEIEFVRMDADIDEDHPASVDYFDAGHATCTAWQPTPPGEDWRLVAVYDTEGGPSAAFVRETGSASA